MTHSQTLYKSIEETFHKPSRDEQLETITRENAAIKIQRAWRVKKQSKYLDPNFLWTDLSLHARLNVDRDAAYSGKNEPRSRWRRATFLVGRLIEDENQVHAPTDEENADAARKHLETQHWLEMIDGKHRYGSNLKYYHKRWEESDTTDNFFRWLDRGAGKDLSLPECPREQLEKERITYLSPQQRLNYLVQIDSEGKLRWVRNGELVDTSAGHWKDGGSDKGIVPLDHPEPAALQARTSFVASSRRSSSSLSGEEATTAMHYYAGQDMSKNPVKRMFHRNFTLRGLLDRLLRKTIRRNTWIYVSDKNFNIFIGIKVSGTFQHSSFLAGGLVTSAGLISVKEGIIHTLSPLSGHYRTTVHHFRQFLAVLEERGVDMHKVQVSKAEVALWGIERLGKFKKRQAQIMKDGKEGAARAVQSAKEVVTHLDEKSQAWKKEILEGRKKAKHDRQDQQSASPADQEG